MIKKTKLIVENVIYLFSVILRYVMPTLITMNHVLFYGNIKRTIVQVKKNKKKYNNVLKLIFTPNDTRVNSEYDNIIS